MLSEIKSGSELGLFEALADTLPALVRICNTEGASIWFNKEWLSFRGRSVEEEQGMGWLEGLHPEDLQQNVRDLWHRFETREPYEIRYRLGHHSGQHRWVLHRAAPRFNSSGEFLGFITACVDIHEATVADFERTQFFKIASDILIISDQAGNIQKVSNACERVLGWTAEELVHSPFRDLLHPDDIVSSFATNDILSSGAELVDFENRCRHRNGEYRWLLWRARLDKVSGLIYASAVDITQRKAFETELQDSIDRYNLAISATSDGIWDWDMPSDKLTLSPRYVEMLGFNDQMPVPRTSAEWRDHIHPDDVVTATEAYEGYINGSVPDYRSVFRAKHADGTWRIILSRGLALRDGAGKAYRMLGVHADITEQQEMESSLRRLKEEAEAASRAKTDFLANMSHEIRTPMNAVIGAAQLLGMGTPLNEKQQKLVSVLQDSSKAMMQLLNDFLDLSKIESGNLEFDQVEFDARRLVAEVVQLLEIQAQAKGLALRQVNDCACVNERLFVGDPSRIKQLLLNLCSNAVKFTESGSVDVEISCFPTEADEVENLCFAIRDTGIGIPKDKLASIFGKFEQGDTTVTRKFGGTGLGLAIVKALVEAMGGQIEVQSEPGSGSSFTVTLPLRRAAEIRLPANDEASVTETVAGAPKILLVEDLPANVLIAQHFLEEFGFAHDLATNGQQALDRIQAGEVFDVILMDVQMPIMDGREATRRIRAFERENRTTPNQIIAITAHAMAKDREECFDAGMDDYITKPFDGRVLEQKLVRAIAIRRKSEDRFLGEVSPSDVQFPPVEAPDTAAGKTK